MRSADDDDDISAAAGMCVHAYIGDVSKMHLNWSEMFILSAVHAWVAKFFTIICLSINYSPTAETNSRYLVCTQLMIPKILFSTGLLFHR